MFASGNCSENTNFFFSTNLYCYNVAIIDKKLFTILKKRSLRRLDVDSNIYITQYLQKIQKNVQKAEKSLKNRIFLVKAEQVIALVNVVDDLLLYLIDDIFFDA